MVAGNGGYHNLHQIADDFHPGLELAPGVVCELADASQYGFVRLTVTGGKLRGEYIGVKPGTTADGSDAAVTRNVDTFQA